MDGLNKVKEEDQDGKVTGRQFGGSRRAGALLHTDPIKIWRLVCRAGVGKSGDVGLTEQIALDSDECRLHRKVCAALEKVGLGNHTLPRQLHTGSVSGWREHFEHRGSV